jgi:hypothetical protein
MNANQSPGAVKTPETGFELLNPLIFYMSMKRFLFLALATLFLSCGVAFAGEAAPAAVPDPGFVLDLTTFAGVVALVSLLGTQLAKLVPAIAEKALWKILVSAALGMAVTLLAWKTGLAAFLSGIAWWHALLYGIGAGLSASGAYDLLRALFAKTDNANG